MLLKTPTRRVAVVSPRSLFFLARVAGVLLVAVCSLTYSGCGGYSSEWETALANLSANEGVIELHEEVVTDVHLELLAKVENLSALKADRSKVTPQGLSTLATKHPKLEHLKLGGDVTNDHLREIARMKALVTLNLPDASFDDNGVEYLIAMPRLELFRFHSPNVTDACMGHIASFPALRFLHVIDAPITDDGLKPLYDKPKLESFYIDGGEVTEQGRDGLYEARPDLHIHVNQQHPDFDPLAKEHDHD